MWRCLYCHNPDTWTMSNGIPVTVAKAAAELRKYRHGLKVMSGGFTLSGGEPLMQHRFAVKLFAAAKAMGIHTALETNGYYGDRLSDAELETIDLVHARHQDVGRRASPPADRDGHRPDARVRPAAGGAKRPMWVRFVLVPGLTDDPDDIAKIASFAAGLGNVERVDVLPFHQLGQYKWKRLGTRLRARVDVEPPSAELVERTCAIFRAAGLKAY